MPKVEMSRKKILMIAPAFYGIERSIAAAFERAGFDTEIVNSRTRPYLLERIFLRISKISAFTEKMTAPILKSYLDRDNERYVAKIEESEPDMVFIIKGETVYPDTLRFIKDKLGVPCVAYVWDCPFYSDAWHVVDIFRKNNFAAGMNLYNHIFSHDPYYVKEIKARGMTHVSYLPLATDPYRYSGKASLPREDKNSDLDICFIGAPTANRIEILNSLSEFKLGVFGDGWDMWHLLRLKRLPVYYKGKIPGEQVPELYRSSRIALNIHGPDAKDGLNTRTFDILACGAFELTDCKPEVNNLFKTGEEIVCYKNKEDLKRLIKLYINDPQARERIAGNGRLKVFNAHTWDHRIRDIVSVMKEKRINDKRQ